LRDAPSLGYARIVRIAVHPDAQRHGLGRRLLAAIAERASAQGLDLIGASFGASVELLDFWRRCALAPLHLGTRRNAASGAQALVVLQALSHAGNGLIEQARNRLNRDLPILASGPLQDAEPALIAALLQEAYRSPCSQAASAATRCETMDADDWQRIHAFADAHLGLEAALPALVRLVQANLSRALEQQTDTGSGCGGLSGREPDLLILSLLQQRPAQTIIAELKLSGRADWLRRLRRAIARLRDLDQGSYRSTSETTQRRITP
jgi:tRNA(Met) cytidine acetyltransferase